MSSEAEFHRNLRSKIADRIANNPKSDYAEGDELYLPSGTKVIFISDLLTHRKGKDDGAQRAYVRLPDGSESSVFLRDLSPEPPQRESTPAQLVSRLLEDHNKIPSVEELFRIFKQVNIDCLKTGESVVDFTDTEFYANQIDAMWEGNDEKVVDAAASALRDYAKAQGYVLPKRRVKESPETVYPDTREGVVAMLQADSQGLNLRRTNIASVDRDPSVNGVWKVDLKDGTRIICYLAGYPDAMGRKRPHNDFEVGEIPVKRIGQRYNNS
jgi:hypothetical protein